MRFTGGVSEEGAVSAGGALANLSACRLVGKSESWRVGGVVQEEEVLVVASASGGWCRCCEVDGRRPAGGGCSGGFSRVRSTGGVREEDAAGAPVLGGVRGEGKRAQAGGGELQGVRGGVLLCSPLPGPGGGGVCQLANLSAFRLVGKSETWRVGGVRWIQGGTSWPR